MLNLIGFLLLVLVALLSRNSGVMANHLLDFGMLVLCGGLFGDLARHLRLPSAIGFVLAGMLLGNSGLEVIGTSLTTDTSIVESIIFMALVANLTASAFAGPGITGHIRTMIAGAFMPVAPFLIGLVIFGLTGLPFRTMLLYSLCAATVSPAMGTALVARDDRRGQIYLLLMSAFVIVFAGWSLFAAADQAFSGTILQLGLLPIATAATSLVAGIIWGLAADTFLPRPDNRYQPTFTALVMFLALPLLRHGGLDMLFFALGFGIYGGMFGSAPSVLPDFSGLLALIVFTLFGTRLSLQELTEVYFLYADAWRMVGLLIGTVIIGRALSVMCARKITGASHLALTEVPPLLAFGPMALVVFHRFVPAFVVLPEARTEGIDRSVAAVIITTMLLFATTTPLLHSLIASIASLRKSHLPDKT